MKPAVRAAAIAATLLMATTANATLHNRGGGLLYDDTLDVTWLQDANYAKTSGYAAATADGVYDLPNGAMSWTSATRWVQQLVYAQTSGWRLPRASPINGTSSGWNYEERFDGSTDTGYSITSVRSELAYMFYVNLGLTGRYDAFGGLQAPYGPPIGNGGVDVGLVRNLENDAYWFGTLRADDNREAWTFYMPYGLQDWKYGLDNRAFAWAVHDGDVSAIPEPSLISLVLSGLGALTAITRRVPAPESRVPRATFA